MLCIPKFTTLSRLLDMSSRARLWHFHLPHTLPADLIIAPGYVTRPSNLANADHDCVVLVTRDVAPGFDGSPTMTRHLRYPYFLIMLLGYVSALLSISFRSRSSLLLVRF